MIRMAAGAQVFLRGRDALQFGLDATRAGIIETPHAPVIMATLLSTRRPRPRTEVEAALTATGLGDGAARSLLDDLLAYRILIPVPDRPHSVVLLGRGRVAQLLTELLHTAGITVRSPMRGESEFAYLAGRDEKEAHVPVLLVDRLAHSRATAPMLSQLARTWVPVAVLDHRGIIGPVRIGAHGPCPLCADLHRTDVDSFWHRTVTQAPGGLVSPAPATVAALAAQAAVVTGELLGVPPPPGQAPVGLHPGEVFTVNPWSGMQREVMSVHPRCPVCF